MTDTSVSIPAWLSSETDQRRLLHLILDMGELMLDSGAEINRVEDTLSRVGHAYGAQMNVFVIIYSIVITMTFPGGAERTLTRRVLNPVQINFKRLERLNDLSRRCCAQPMDLETLATELEIVRGERFGSRRAFIGNMLGAFSFAVFFGGSIADGLASAGFAVLVVLLDKAVGRLCPNRIIYNLIVSTVVGICIGVYCRIFTSFSVAMVMIGDIMLLNPGVTMVNAVREMMVGNMISGQMRLGESFMWAVSLAVGFMVAIGLTGV